MKKKFAFQKMMVACIVILLISAFNVAIAQTETTTAPVDTVEVVKSDTVQVAEIEPKEKKTKRKDEFIIYGGANIGSLQVSANEYDSSAKVGYNLGFAYRRGQFFYWQLGAEYSNALYEFQNLSGTSDLESFSVSSIDVPFTVGINILSVTNRILGLRTFIGLVPSYNIGVSDDSNNVDKDGINSFMFSGQVGVGVNVFFFILDVGYNYGFNDIFPDVESRPGQAFVNLGFRF